MELAKLATSPAAAVSLIPSHFPAAIKGRRKTFVITNISGNAPASTMAIAPTVSKPSETGAMPGMMV